MGGSLANPLARTPPQTGEHLLIERGVQASAFVSGLSNLAEAPETRSAPSWLTSAAAARGAMAGRCSDVRLTVAAKYSRVTGA